MSDIWGTAYQLERDKAIGNDPASLRAEITRLTELCSAYKGQVEAGAIEIDRLRRFLELAVDAYEDEHGEPNRESHWAAKARGALGHQQRVDGK